MMQVMTEFHYIIANAKVQKIESEEEKETDEIEKEEPNQLTLHSAVHEYWVYGNFDAQIGMFFDLA